MTEVETLRAELNALRERIAVLETRTVGLVKFGVAEKTPIWPQFAPNYTPPPNTVFCTTSEPTHSKGVGSAGGSGKPGLEHKGGVQYVPRTLNFGPDDGVD